MQGQVLSFNDWWSAPDRDHYRFAIILRPPLLLRLRLRLPLLLRLLPTFGAPAR